MLPEARRRLLLNQISRQGFATLEDLVASVGASESTVRRDLDALDLSGAIKRTHGGAVCAGEVRSMPSLDERSTTATGEKRAIARVAAALVRDGDTVLLDGGTTTLEVARVLVGRPVQIVTNSLPIAQLVTARGETDLILIGGYVYPRTGVAMGPLAIATMRGLTVRLVMMGAGGIVAEGIYNSNSLLVDTERTMMACGQEVIVVADHSKFGRLSLAKLCGLDEVSRFIVDGGLTDEYRAMLDSRGIPYQLAVDDEPATSASRSTTHSLSGTRNGS